MDEERNYEEEARAQGWRPQEEYSGDPERWTDAKTFVEKGEKIAGILKSRVEKLETRLEEAERANREFGQYTKAQLAKERQKSADKIAQLEAQLAQAITDGDGQAFTKLNNEISQERSRAPFEQNVDAAALASEWLKNNPWYNADTDLQIYADGLAERVANEGYQGKAYYKEITDRVRARFPEKFENPNKKRANGVESAGEIETQDSRPHTYANLPPDAKSACDMFVKQGLMTKEEYVKAYEWE